MSLATYNRLRIDPLNPLLYASKYFKEERVLVCLHARLFNVDFKVALLVSEYL